ncbi:hypothetical protein ACXGPA_13465 [Enterobacter asburiae]
MPADSIAASPDGIAPGAWIDVGDALLRCDRRALFPA